MIMVCALFARPVWFFPGPGKLWRSPDSKLSAVLTETVTTTRSASPSLGPRADSGTGLS